MTVFRKSALAIGIVVGVAVIMLVASVIVGQPDVVIGGKNFTEQHVLGQMMAILIEEHTDLKVGRQLGLGGTMVCFNAVKGGDLDLYAEYTGTGLVNILERGVIADPQDAYNVVKEEFKEQWNLVWLEPFGFSNAYTLTMRRKQAEELGIETVSDLAEYVRGGGKLTAGFEPEFLSRPDGYPGLKKVYDFRFPSQPKQLDPGLMYKSVAEKEVDVVCGYATEGRIPAYDLVILEDDKGFFPPYHAAPLIRQSTLDRYPQLRDVLNRLGGRISSEEMQELNFRVDEKKEDARKVAREFLMKEGLLSPTTQPAAGTSPSTGPTTRPS